MLETQTSPVGAVLESCPTAGLVVGGGGHRLLMQCLGIDVLFVEGWGQVVVVEEAEGDAL